MSNDTMPRQNLGVVLVHGSWHRPEHWGQVTERLKSRGYEVQTPSLPSCTDVGIIEDAWNKDIAMVRSAIEHFTHAGTNVVVALHSYAGTVGSEAVAEVSEQLKILSESDKRKHGRIVHLVYVCPIILDRGMSIASAGLPPHAFSVEDGLSYHLEPYNRFYHLTPPDIARKAIDRLRPIVVDTALVETKYCGWSDYGLPVTFVDGKHDKAFDGSPECLDRMQAGGVGDLTVKVIESDHSPWLSKEEDFMTILDEVLAKAEKAL